MDIVIDLLQVKHHPIADFRQLINHHIIAALNAVSIMAGVILIH
ncbi:hypothetical protein [Erwinia pyrifoliae]